MMSQGRRAADVVVPTQMFRTSCDTRSTRRERLALAASALLFLATASCARRDEQASKPAPTVSVSASLPTTATQTKGEKDGAEVAEPQPDFIKHPPLNMKPPCAGSIESAANDGERRCVALTLRCPELDPGESVWLATTPPVAKIKLPEGSRGMRVAAEDEVSATVCCKPASAEPRPVKAQIRLFTNEVAGATQTIECP